jgi:cell division protease FtsH
MQDKARFHVIYLIIAVVGVLLIQQFLHDARTVALIPYSDFHRLLQERQVTEVEIVGDTLQGALKQPHEGKQRFVTTRVDPQLASELNEAGVRYARREENTFLPNLLGWIVPSLLFFFVWAFFIRRLAERAGPGGGLMAVGKSKAKSTSRPTPR